jgi:hypothetical protein
MPARLQSGEIALKVSRSSDNKVCKLDGVHMISGKPGREASTRSNGLVGFAKDVFELLKGTPATTSATAGTSAY